MTALTTSVEENPMGSYHQSGTFIELLSPTLTGCPPAICRISLNIGIMRRNVN